MRFIQCIHTHTLAAAREARSAGEEGGGEKKSRTFIFFPAEAPPPLPRSKHVGKFTLLLSFRENGIQVLHYVKGPRQSRVFLYFRDFFVALVLCALLGLGASEPPHPTMHGRPVLRAEGGGCMGSGLPPFPCSNSPGGKKKKLGT